MPYSQGSVKIQSWTAMNNFQIVLVYFHFHFLQILMLMTSGVDTKSCTMKCQKHDELLFLAVFQIHYSHWLRNVIGCAQYSQLQWKMEHCTHTAKSFTEYNQNICSMEFLKSTLKLGMASSLCTACSMSHWQTLKGSFITFGSLLIQLPMFFRFSMKGHLIPR